MMQIKSITSRTAKDTDIWRLLIITITTMKNHFVKIIKTAIWNKNCYFQTENKIDCLIYTSKNYHTFVHVYPLWTICSIARLGFISGSNLARLTKRLFEPRVSYHREIYRLLMKLLWRGLQATTRKWKKRIGTLENDRRAVRKENTAILVITTTSFTHIVCPERQWFRLENYYNLTRKTST